MKKKYHWGAMLFISFQLCACADVARWVRQYTYPSEFRYIERDELRSEMRQLASHSRALKQLLESSEDPQSQRMEILAHVTAMERSADKLDQSGWASNHAKIDMNLPRFRTDLRLAREAVEREPPNFLLAGSMSGACVYCHGAQ
jgi:hypothetical protein